MGGEMMPHPSGGKNGGNEKKKGGGGKRSRPSFQASFPAPRRAAPSLHGSDLSHLMVHCPQYHRVRLGQCVFHSISRISRL